MMDIIRSRQHPLCKLVRALHSAKGRKQHNLFAAEGGNAVAAALGARWPLRELLLPATDEARDWAHLAANVGVPSRFFEEELFASLHEAQTATEAIALAKMPAENTRDAEALARSLNENLSTQSADCTLVLDGLGDPNNVGALLRTADAAGIARLITTSGSADAFSLKAVRISAGSVFHVPLFSGAPDELISVLENAQVPIAVAVAHNGENALSTRWPSRCALVLGHETRGISQAWEEAASLRLTIPMFGRAESLNVAAAGAILMYAWRASF